MLKLGDQFKSGLFESPAAYLDEVKKVLEQAKK